MKDIVANWKFILFEGVILVILGLLALAMPVIATFGLALFAGWILIIVGVMTGFRAFRVRGQDDFWISLLSGLAFVLIGILMINHPVATIFTLTGLVTSFLAVEGISKLFLFSYLEKVNYRWILLVSGGASLLLAILVWVGWPDTTHWFIGLIFGINLIFAGTALSAVALQARNQIHR